MENLKQEPKVEGATPTVEGEKPATPEAKQAVSITETEEFQKAVSKAVSKGLESVDRQLSIRVAESKTAKAEAEMLKSTMTKYEADLKELQDERDKLAEERFADDPVALKGYKDSRAISVREKKAQLREEQLKLKEAELEGLRWAIEMHKEADEIQKQHKVPREVLEVCSSKEQMLAIAKAFPEVEKVEEKKEGKTPKFDPGVSSGSGGKLTPEMVTKMSPDERFNRRKEIDAMVII
jgi:myosin heavy subunit